MENELKEKMILVIGSHSNPLIETIAERCAQVAMEFGLKNHPDHEIIALKEENAILHAKVEKLQAFKDFVHNRLDEAGIEKEPNGEHSKNCCRIGDRLDIALQQATVVEQGKKLICPNCGNPYPHTKADGTHYCEECWMSWAH
jgi:hypothetical protein